MALFFGRRSKQVEETVEEPPVEPTTMEVEEPVSRGPRDSDGADAPQGYIDLGALFVPKVTGLQLRGAMDDSHPGLKRILLVLGSSGVAVSIAAAPKSGGAWEELSTEICASLKAGGGECDKVAGPYGVEIHGKVPSELPDGSKGLSPLRILGVEGPRWVARLDIQGAAAAGDPNQTEAIENLIDQLIVNRGSEPRIRFELLELRLPKEVSRPQQD